MSKHDDYKTADAPKAEPLKASLSEKLRAAWASTKTPIHEDDLSATLSAANAAKEQTP